MPVAPSPNVSALLSLDRDGISSSRVPVPPGPHQRTKEMEAVSLVWYPAGRREEETPGAGPLGQHGRPAPVRGPAWSDSYVVVVDAVQGLKD